MNFGRSPFSLVVAFLAVAVAGVVAVWSPPDRGEPGIMHLSAQASPDGSVGAAADRPSVVNVRARGRLGTEDMVLRINGEVVSTWDDISKTERVYSHTIERSMTVERLQVGVGDGGGWPASLVIDRIEIDGIVYESEAVGTSSRGSWNPATGCRPGYKQSEWLQCHIGWFDYEAARGISLFGPPTVPAQPPPPSPTAPPVTSPPVTASPVTAPPVTSPPITASPVTAPPKTAPPTSEADTASVITIRGRGRLGTETMELRINGRPVKTWNGLSTDFDDHRVEIRRPQTIDSLEVAIVGGGWPQALIVDNVDVDGTVHQSESPETRSAGSWTSATGCRSGNKRSEWLHCNDGHFEYRSAAGTVLAAGGDGQTPPPSPDRKHLLVLTKASVYSHPSIGDGMALVDRLAAEQGFDVTYSENSTLFQDRAAVAPFDAVLFLNTDSVVFETPAQKQAFQQFIESGKGYLGIHGAAATHWNEDKWDWYRDLVGQRFVNHPTTPNQSATINVMDGAHPSTAHLSDTWEVRDEWYNFEGLPGEVNVLLAVDETTYSGGTMGDWHPIAWNHLFGPGRSRVWYSNLGHERALYSNPDYIQHVRGGIEWVLNG